MKAKFLLFIISVSAIILSCSQQEEQQPYQISKYSSVNHGDIIESYDGSITFAYDSAFVNPSDSIGREHNLLMNYYGTYIDSIAEKSSWKYVADITYAYSTVLGNNVNVNFPDSLLNSFYNGLCYHTENFNYVENPLSEVSNAFNELNIEINEEFYFDFDQLLSKLYTLNLFVGVDTLYKDMKIIEQKIVNSNYSDREIATVLTFCSVFKNSYKQIRDDFSHPSHPLNGVYFRDSFKSQLSNEDDNIDIAIADALGAAKGVYSSWAMGPWGWVIFGVGYGAGSSIGEALKQVAVELAKDAID